MTCRIPSDDASAIRSEATTLGISPAAMYSNILSRYARWDRYAQKLEMVQVPKEVLSAVVTEWDEKQARTVASAALRFMKSAVIMMKGKYDLKRTIETLEQYMRVTGMASDHTVDGNIHRFTIRHDMGMPWSVFVRAVLQNVFGTFVPGVDVEFDVHDDMVSVSVALGSDWDEHCYSILN